MTAATLTYPWDDVAADYLRAGVGLGLTLVPLIALETAIPVAAVLSGAALLFGAFAVRTINLHLSRIEVDDVGLRHAGLVTRAIRWSDLDGLTLAFYAHRRDRSEGWMRLRLSGQGQRLAVESGLQGFEALAERALRAARDNGITLDERSLANLETLGVNRQADGALLGRLP